MTAATEGLPFDRIGVYEVPYMTSEEMVSLYQDYVQELTQALVADDRDEALELFMRLAGSSEEDIAIAKQSTFWPGLKRLAPTLAYDAACLGDGRVPVARLAGVTQPTLVVTGGAADPHTGGLQPGFFDAAADAIAASIPNAERRIVPGQGHVADAAALAPLLTRFLL